MSDFCSKEGFNCKYCEEGECVFYSMGSGQMIDMPCFDYDEFEWISKDVLDKIRAEIMQLDYDLEWVDYDYNDMPQTEMIHTICREEVLQIIDKYKAESEDEE